MVPRENKNNAYAKFGGTNKVYYGILPIQLHFHANFSLLWCEIQMAAAFPIKNYDFLNCKNLIITPWHFTDAIVFKKRLSLVVNRWYSKFGN